jgi:hypothetical protein
VALDLREGEWLPARAAGRRKRALLRGGAHGEPSDRLPMNPWTLQRARNMSASLAAGRPASGLACRA